MVGPEKSFYVSQLRCLARLNFSSLIPLRHFKRGADHDIVNSGYNYDGPVIANNTSLIIYCLLTFFKGQQN